VEGIASFRSAGCFLPISRKTFIADPGLPEVADARERVAQLKDME